MQVTKSLAENFKMTFDDIRSHATVIRTFEYPFSVEVSDPRETVTWTEWTAARIGTSKMEQIVNFLAGEAQAQV